MGAARAPAANYALASLQSFRSELLAQRAELDAQIQAVDHAVKVMGGAAARVYAPAARVVAKRRGPRAGRGPRTGSLKDHVLKVLGIGKTMAVKDITSGVLAAGYKSKNKTLAKSVGIALKELPSVRKVGRGKFRGL